MKLLGLKLNQIAFLIGGLALLASLPWFGVWEVWLWLTAQMLFVLGTAFVLKNV
jgi:hypothetical protein